MIGAGPDGLDKVCCGADDKGTDIDAYFVPATGDFGMGRKRAMGALFEMECDGAMQISLTGDGKTTIGPYPVTAEVDEGAQMRRIPLGRGMKFKYGKAKIENVDGASFSIDKIILLLEEVAGGK